MGNSKRKCHATSRAYPSTSAAPDRVGENGTRARMNAGPADNGYAITTTRDRNASTSVRTKKKSRARPQRNGTTVHPSTANRRRTTRRVRITACANIRRGGCAISFRSACHRRVGPFPRVPYVVLIITNRYGGVTFQHGRHRFRRSFGCFVKNLW